MTNRRSYLILVGLIALALAGVVALALPSSPAHKKVTLGLDLQGGLEVVLKAVPLRNQQITSDGMNTAISIMRKETDEPPTRSPADKPHHTEIPLPLFPLPSPFPCRFPPAREREYRRPHQERCRPAR